MIVTLSLLATTAKTTANECLHYSECIALDIAKTVAATTTTTTNTLNFTTEGRRTALKPRVLFSVCVQCALTAAGTKNLPRTSCALLRLAIAARRRGRVAYDIY